MKRIISGCVALVLGVLLCACGSPVYSEPETTEGVPEYGYASMDEAIEAYMQMRISVVPLDHIRRMSPERVWNDPETIQQAWGGSIEEGYAAYKEGVQNELDYYKEKYGDDSRITWEVTNVEDFTEGGPYTEEDNQGTQDQYGVDAKDVKYYSVKMTKTIKGSKGEWIDTECYCYPIKALDTWYVY